MRDSTTSARARSCSPPPTSAGSSAIPTSSTGRCWPGATTVLYEGKPVGTPDAGQFWRVVADYGVKSLFTAPTAFRAIRKADPPVTRRPHDVSSLQHLFLAGERLDPETLTGGRPKALEHPGDRSTGGRPRPAGRSCGDPARHRAAAGQGGLTDHADAGLGRADPGSVRPRRWPAGEDGGDRGSRLPLPPGSLPTLWRDDDRYVESYLSTYPGYYLTGDGGHLDADGYLFVMGRTDDVIDVAGHRLSTGAWRRCWPRIRRSPSAR